ncbi:MAG: hypothetical protein R3D68_02755 [Hyphomicrobiaceae bacterium]
MARSIFDGAFGPAAANPLAVLAASCLVGLLATTSAHAPAPMSLL